MSDGMASSACLGDCLTETADLQDYTCHQMTVRDPVPQWYIKLLWTARHDILETIMQSNCQCLG